MMMTIIERTSKRNHSKPFNIKPSFDWLQLLNNMQQKKALVHLERPLYFFILNNIILCHGWASSGNPISKSG